MCSYQAHKAQTSGSIVVLPDVFFFLAGVKAGFGKNFCHFANPYTRALLTQAPFFLSFVVLV